MPLVVVPFPQTTPFFTHLWVIKHKIEGGPFEHMTEEKLKHDKSRIFVTFEGMDSVMHDSIYVQKTYTSDEIRFNSKFRWVHTAGSHVASVCAHASQRGVRWHCIVPGRCCTTRAKGTPRS